MRDHLETRPGVYADSVRLMQVSREIADLDGVGAALIAMATELNLDVLAGMGFEPPRATTNDLVVAIRAEPDALDAALVELDRALTAGSSGGGDPTGETGGRLRPRTVREAARSGADLALVSVPGEHAFVEALDALEAGLHVMLFSDGVPVEQEVALKRRADELGLLLMGPDAGTAIVSGVGLGFANVLGPGPVGVVAASGTGAQQLTCLLDSAGVGVSHVLGVGGRDLSAPVGGLASRAALDALEEDPATEMIVWLSKPPDPSVVAEVRQHVAGYSTPVVEAFVGPGGTDLTRAAQQVMRSLGVTVPEPRSWTAPQARSGGYTELRGLFAGGTLCDEAIVVAGGQLDGVASNLVMDGVAGLVDGLDSPGHVLVDLGEDEFTRGRPHPMIDQSLRVERIHAEMQRPGERVVLLDVVLGHAAHPDPAAELAPAIEEAVGTSRVAVVVSVCGTAGDPQGRDMQAERMAAAGASVHLSNARAAAEAVALVAGGDA